MLSTKLTHPQLDAGSATPPPIVSIGVGFVEGVAVDAVGLPFLAVNQATRHVDALRDGFKVIGPHAVSHSAQMVKLQSNWNATVNHFEQVPVSMVSLSPKELAVTVPSGTRPEPAGVRFSDVLPEVRVEDGKLTLHREVSFLGDMEPSVQSAAAPFYCTKVQERDGVPRLSPE